MIGPTRKPQDFGFQDGDSHLIVNDWSELMTAYDYTGKKLWEIPCLARGQYGDRVYQEMNSDTPPGLYKLGTVYRDWETHGDNAPNTGQTRPYGWYTFDMVELEGQEVRFNRAGICLHGGGSACGWPGAWAPHQRLYPTHGCVRLYNQDLRDKILPLYDKGTVFVSVFQED
jgi:hypothetical protein